MAVRRTLLVALLFTLLGCHHPAPPPQPPEPPVTTAVWHVFVHDVKTLTPLEGAAVYFNGAVTVTNPDGYAAQVLPLGLNGIVVKADGYFEQSIDIDLQEDTTTQVNLEHVPPPIRRLSTCGIHFCFEGGERWNWHGMTAFSLAYDIAVGNEQNVEVFLDFAKERGITIIRVFTTAVNLFDLDPESGRRASERLLTLAENRGLYTELVGLADTAQRSFDHQDHLWRLGVLCASHPGCLIEVANEPNHPTQDTRVKEVGYLSGLLREVKQASPQTLVALGASHGADDENPIYWVGDYATVHGDRKGGWESVRHVREQQALRDGPLSLTLPKRMPAVNDEPDRDLAIDQHLGMGLLTQLYGLGDTIHLTELRYGRVVESEVPMIDARIRGWNALPSDWEGTYCNNSTVSCNGAVKSFNDHEILRLYGAMKGDFGYIVGLGVRSESSIEWQWPHRALVNEGQARLWSVFR